MLSEGNALIKRVASVLENAFSLGGHGTGPPEHKGRRVCSSRRQAPVIEAPSQEEVDAANATVDWSVPAAPQVSVEEHKEFGR